MKLTPCRSRTVTALGREAPLAAATTRATEHPIAARAPKARTGRNLRPNYSGSVKKRLGLRGLRAARKLLDLPLGSVELAEAELVELLAALPEADRLVELRVAALQPLDDLLELPLSVLERRLRTHSTRAPKRPSATSTS